MFSAAFCKSVKPLHCPSCIFYFSLTFCHLFTTYQYNVIVKSAKSTISKIKVYKISFAIYIVMCITIQTHMSQDITIQFSEGIPTQGFSSGLLNEGPRDSLWSKGVLDSGVCCFIGLKLQSNLCLRPHVLSVYLSYVASWQSPPMNFLC